MCLLINWWFIIFKKFPEIPVGKLIEQDFSGHYSGKSPEVTECLRSYSCFPSQNILHRNSCSISSNPSLTPVSGFHGQFTATMTGLWKW